MTIEAIPLHLFGKDHWSLLAYLNERCARGIQGVGTIVKTSMRCNDCRHADLAPKPMLSPWNDDKSTRTTGCVNLGHDDWDCLYELQGAGLVELANIQTLLVRMTPEGLRITARLRDHKARGGNFGNFKLQG